MVVRLRKHSQGGNEKKLNHEGLPEKLPENLSENLSVRTYNLLSAMILNGELAYGDPVQERPLAETLNVSRTPVREAINKLEAEGLLKRTGGLVIVREVNLKELVEILHIRKLMECDAARQAAKNVDLNDLTKIRSTIERILKKKNVTAIEFKETDDLFHNFIAKASGNKLITELIINLRRRMAMFDHDAFPNRLGPGSREHLEIIDALEKRDGTQASARMARHINNVHRSIFDHWGLII